jgi:HPt (histidine-containing phosphotransfer) domain-containing protein
VANDAAVLDAERLTMLRELDPGDGTLLRSLAEEYTADAYAQVALMRTALADQDVHTLERAAHSLKGASANLGASALAERCLSLEVMGREGTIDGADDIVASVAADLAGVEEALRQVVAEA